MMKNRNAFFTICAALYSVVLLSMEVSTLNYLLPYLPFYASSHPDNALINLLTVSREGEVKSLK